MNNIYIIAGLVAGLGVLGIIIASWKRLRAGPPLPIKRRRIVLLDLDLVREKAVKRHKWDEAKGKTLEDEYRDFLILLAENGGTISPWSDDLDLFWHEHILNTRKYHEDCKYIFGHLIQHDPHIEKNPYRHAETRETTITLREAQLKARAERQKQAQATSGVPASSSDGFDVATWGCSSEPSHSTHHDGGSSHSDTSHASCAASHSSGHSCGGGHSDGGGGHSCGGHSCGGHGCGGHGCGGGH